MDLMTTSRAASQAEGSRGTRSFRCKRAAGAGPGCVALSPEQLTRFARPGAGGGEELLRLLRLGGLVPERIERTRPQVMREMCSVCSGCEAVRRCRRDLDRGWAPVVQRYCHTETIKALQAERCRAVS